MVTIIQQVHATDGFRCAHPTADAHDKRARCARLSGLRISIRFLAALRAAYPKGLRRPERSIQSNVQEALKRKLFSIIKGKGKEKSEGIEIILR